MLCIYVGFNFSSVVFVVIIWSFVCVFIPKLKEEVLLVPLRDMGPCRLTCA